MPRQKITQTDREQKEFRTLIRTIDTMCDQAYKNKSVLSKLKVSSRFLITIIEDLDKKEETKWLLQKLEKANLNYLFKNLGGYSMDSKTKSIWLEEGLLRNEVREKILQRCEILRYMGDDGIPCIFDQLPDHELVEDCGWVLDKAHDDLDNFKLGLIRS